MASQSLHYPIGWLSHLVRQSVCLSVDWLVGCSVSGSINCLFGKTVSQSTDLDLSISKSLVFDSQSVGCWDSQWIFSTVYFICNARLRDWATSIQQTFLFCLRFCILWFFSFAIRIASWKPSKFFLWLVDKFEIKICERVDSDISL